MRTYYTCRAMRHTSVGGENGELVDASLLVIERGGDTNLTGGRIDLELAIFSKPVAHRVVDNGVDPAIWVCR